MSYYENLPFFGLCHAKLRVLCCGCIAISVFLGWGKEGSKAHWIIYARLCFLTSVARACDTHVHEVEDGILESLFHVLISLSALFVCSFFVSEKWHLNEVSIRLSQLLCTDLIVILFCVEPFKFLIVDRYLF